MVMRAIGAENAEVIEGEAEDVTAFAKSIDDDERAILEDFGAAADKATWKIQIWRVGEGRRGWIIDISPAQLPYMEKLRKLAGPGSYEGLCYRGRGKSPKHVLKWEIEQLIGMPEERGSPGDSALTQAVAGMMAIQRELVAQLSAMKTATPAPAAPQSSMSEMMQGFASMMREVREMNPPPPPPPPIHQPDPFKMMENVFGLVKDLAGSDREKGTLETIAEMVTSGGFAELLKGLQPQQPTALPAPQHRRLPPGQPAPARQPQPAGAAQAPASAPAPAGGVHPFAGQIEILLTGAQKNIDPSSYADVVGATLDDVQLKQLLSIPDPIQMLVLINPNVEPFRDWFTEFFEALTVEPQEADISGHVDGRDASAFGDADDSERGGGSEDDSQADEGEG